MRSIGLKAAAIIAFAVVLFPSCSKEDCQDCDCQGSGIKTVCEDQFDTKEEYDANIDFYNNNPNCSCS